MLHRVFFVLAVAALAPACSTSLRNVPLEKDKTVVLQKKAVVGSVVRVTTRSGQVFEVLVESIDDVALAGRSEGRDVRVPLDDIVGFQSQQFDLGKTAMATVEATGAVIAITAYVAAQLIPGTVNHRNRP